MSVELMLGDFFEHNLSVIAGASQHKLLEHTHVELLWLFALI